MSFDASSFDSALGEVVDEAVRVVRAEVREVEPVGHVDDVRDGVGLRDKIGVVLAGVDHVDPEDGL